MKRGFDFFLGLAQWMRKRRARSSELEQDVSLKHKELVMTGKK